MGIIYALIIGCSIALILHKFMDSFYWIVIVFLIPLIAITIVDFKRTIFRS